MLFLKYVNITERMGKQDLNTTVFFVLRIVRVRRQVRECSYDQWKVALFGPLYYPAT
jgi:hypothetical protein